MGLRLTVLGHCSPYPRPGGACPGYLVETACTRVLVDCGSGIVARLGRTASGPAGLDGLDAVVLSHLHADHFSDVLVLRYAADAAMRLGRRSGPLCVYAPAEPAVEFGLLSYRQALRAVPVDPRRELGVGDLVFRFTLTRHPVPTLGMLIEAGGRRLGYTADTAYDPALAGFFEGVDLLLAEATFTEAWAGGRADEAGHMTAEGAARLAARAGARRLLLTHFLPLLDPAEVGRAARAVYAEAEVSVEGTTYEVW